MVEILFDVFAIIFLILIIAMATVAIQLAVIGLKEAELDHKSYKQALNLKETENCDE